MIKYKLRYLCTLLFLFFAQSIFADSMADIFNPPAVSGESDISIKLLGQIFGSVDGVLHGYGSEVLGAMFGVFNSAVIGLGGIVILYTVIVSTLNTANEGEVLGKKWNSMWIPFRLACGTAILIPKASGYSMIQIFIMWVVLQGVGAADSLWGTAANYIMTTGTIMPISMSNDNATNLVKNFEPIISLQACVADLQNYYNTNNTGLIVQASQPLLDKDAQVWHIQFPGNPDGTTIMPANKLACGEITWSQYLTKNIDPKTHKPIPDPLIDPAQSQAMQQIVLDLGPFAQQYIQDQINGIDISQDQTAGGLALQDAVLDYNGIMSPAYIRVQSASNSAAQGQIQNSVSQGWISAGSYYELLVSVNGSAQAAMNGPGGYQPPSVPPATSSTPPPYSTPNPFADNNFVTNFNNYIVNNLQKASFLAIQTKAINTLEAGTGGNWKLGNLGPTFQSGSAVGGVIVGIMTGGLSALAQSAWKIIFQDAYTGGNSSNQGHEDPILAVTDLGHLMLEFVGTVWIVWALIFYAFVAGTAICSASNPLGFAGQAILMWVVPFMTAVMVMMFTTGTILAFYIPLIPFIIFLFGAMGWILGVIESMVAGPLVALGIVYPEGQHEIWGRADPAVMLLTNIFLRPSLMVIGFVCGILLSYVGLMLLNFGFSIAVPLMPNNGMGLFSWMFFPIAMMILYTVIVVGIIQKSFTMITEVPNKVLRWLSGGEQQLGDGGADAVMQQAQGVMGNAGNQFGSAGGQATQKAVEQSMKHKAGSQTIGGEGGSPPAAP